MMLRSQPDERTAGKESALLDYVERLARYREGRQAVQIHLSRLLPQNRREHHLRIAKNTFEDIVKLFEGQLFILSNSDIVFICRGATTAAMQNAVMRVQYLFSEDPLIAADGSRVADAFSTWYDLERDYERFLDRVRRQHDEEIDRQRRVSSRGSAPEASAPSRPPVDAHHVGGVVDTIARADLSNVMRRQSVCMVVPNTPPQPIFRELFISIQDLRDLVMPGYDIAAERSLFQYLTLTLDRRMLAMLRKNDDSAISNAFSLNLNVASLLSEEFLAFDQSLRGPARGTIVIELQYPDIVADLSAFSFARDFAKGRKYRMCLDGVTEPMMPFIDRERLGVDFVKLIWSPSLATASGSSRSTEFRDAVAKFGRARTILCRCDDAAAIEFGQKVGITMFQGHAVERLLGAGAGKGGQSARAAAAPQRERAFVAG